MLYCSWLQTAVATFGIEIKQKSVAILLLAAGCRPHFGCVSPLRVCVQAAVPTAGRWQHFESPKSRTHFNRKVRFYRVNADIYG